MPVFFATEARQPVWVCVALQQHTEEARAFLFDVRRDSALGSHEETLPAPWASSLLATHPDGSPPALWDLGRPKFKQLDAVWGPHAVDRFPRKEPQM